MHLTPTDRALVLGYLLLALSNMGYSQSVVDDICAEVSASISVYPQKNAIQAHENFRATKTKECI